MTRIQDHEPLHPGPGQKVEYHSRHYYDGWDGVPDRLKGDGWVLVNHDAPHGANFTDYSFQRLVDAGEKPMSEQSEHEDRQAYDSQDRTEQLLQNTLAQLDEVKGRLKAAEERSSQALAQVEPPVSQVEPTMTIESLRRRDTFIKDVINGFFQEGIHFGVPFPTSKDKMLYKVGAEWFASSFGVRPNYTPLDEIAEEGNVFYRYRCDLVYFLTGQVIGQAEGICSGAEDKYKYRISNYKCPSCKQETIMPSSYGAGGWYCNVKKGGCGAKYPKGEVTIESQPKPARVLNAEVKGLAHTISAMAQKRAFVLALKGAFGLGAYIKYFEGIDDLDDPMVVNGTATVKDDAPAHVKQYAQEARERQRAESELPPSDSAALVNGAHWTTKKEPRENFDRAMRNTGHEPDSDVVRTALGATDPSVTLDALLALYDTVGAAINTVRDYLKERAAV